MMNISGQIDSKEQEGIERFQSEVSELMGDTPATNMDKSKSIVAGESDGEFESLKMAKLKSADDSLKRKDRNGNVITTEIGRFSLINAGKKSKARKTVVGAGTGGKEEEGQNESPEKKTRHKVTFMDEVTNDKTQLTEIHLIESYKKYNQEFYIDN
jgi:hypothetical protein